MRALVVGLGLVVVGCGGGSGKRSPGAGSSAARPSAGVLIDRFSARAGHIMVRDSNPALPAPGAPYRLDDSFLTQALGPDGAIVRYYHFDIQPALPALVYRAVRAGSHDALAGQPDVIDVIPGDDGYSDFFRFAWVEVPADFRPGSLRSLADIETRGYRIELDGVAHNCPVVPRGTSAAEGQPTTTTRLYRGGEVTCLRFAAELTLDAAGQVPTSDIYVTFRKNPGARGGGPPSGFMREPRSVQTHNVVFSVPGDLDYSPLWAVHIYDNAVFERVRDADSAMHAPVLVPDGPLVNCPVVFVGVTQR